MSDVLTVFMMALALSMDAFSISVGLGLLGISIRRIVLVGSTVGFFHIIMPLTGIFIGRLLSQYMGALAYFIGGSGLIVLGLQMVMSSFRQDALPVFSLRGTGVLLFALTVSMDSLSAGLSLGMLGARTWLIVLSFGAASAIFTCAGLFLGKKAGSLMGSSAEWIGGFVLIAFGVKMVITPF